MTDQYNDKDAGLHTTPAKQDKVRAADLQQRGKPDERQVGGQNQDTQQSEQANQDPFADLDEPSPNPDEDQYGNLDEPDMDLYGNLEDLQMGQYSDPDAEAQDQYGSQNPVGSANEPDTPGGEGLYDVQDQYGRGDTIVKPGSERDQYGTRGSQDQYGYQQEIK